MVCLGNICTNTLRKEAKDDDDDDNNNNNNNNNKISSLYNINMLRVTSQLTWEENWRFTCEVLCEANERAECLKCNKINTTSW
jgi:hypothetical protein